MWAVVEFLRAVTPTLSEHVRVGEGSAAGSNMDRSAAGEIEAVVRINPSLWVPGPAGDRVIDNCGPDEHVNDAGQYATPLSNGANGESDTGDQSTRVSLTGLVCRRVDGDLRDTSEHALVNGEEQIGNARSANTGPGEDTLEAEVVECTDKWASVVREG